MKGKKGVSWQTSIKGIPNKTGITEGIWHTEVKDKCTYKVSREEKWPTAVVKRRNIEKTKEVSQQNESFIHILSNNSECQLPLYPHQNTEMNGLEGKAGGGGKREEVGPVDGI